MTPQTYDPDLALDALREAEVWYNCIGCGHRFQEMELTPTGYCQDCVEEREQRVESIMKKENQT